MKPENKKPENKKPEDKKPEDKKSEDKKPENKKSKDSQRRKPRRWRRRLLYAACIFLALMVLLRIVLSLSLKSILRKAAQHYELDLNYEELSLSLLSGEVELWHLELTPSEGGERLLHVEYCCADIEVSALLMGRLFVRRLETDGMDVLLERDADGQFPVLKRFQGGQEGEEAPAPQPEEALVREAPEPQPVDLRLAFRCDAIRLQHMHVHVRDNSVTPALETRCDLHLRVSDLGSEHRRARMEVNFSMGDIVDALILEGTGSSGKDRAEASFNVSLRGLHPRALAGHLRPLGLRPVADRVALTCRASISGRRAAADETAFAFDINLEDMKAVVDGQDEMVLDSVAISVDAANRSYAKLGRIAVQGGQALARRTRSGAIRVAGFDFSPLPRTVQKLAAQKKAVQKTVVRKPSAPVAPVPEKQGHEPAVFAWLVREVAFSDLKATFQDEALSEQVHLSFSLDSLVLRDVVSQAFEPREPVTFQGRFSAAGIVEAMHLNGTATLFTPARRLSASFSMDGITAGKLGPYLKAFNAEPALSQGTFKCAIEAGVRTGPDDCLNGEFALKDIQFADGRELFNFAGINVDGISVDQKASVVRVDAVTVTGPRVTVQRDAQGALSAMGIRIHPRGGDAVRVQRASETDEGRSTEEAGNPPGPAAPLPAVEIGRFLWKDSQVAFTDEAVAPPAALSIADAGLAIEGCRIELDPEAKRPAPAKLRAWMALPDCTESVIAEGTLVAHIAEPGADMAITGKRITVDALAPYLKVLGMKPALKDGSVTLRLGARLSLKDGGAAGSAYINEFAYKDGGNELLGLTALRLDDINLTSEGLRIKEVAVASPRALVSRTDQGALQVAGIELGPVPVSAEGGDEAKPGDAPVPSKPGQDKAKTEASPAPGLKPIVVDRFRLSDATLRWADAAVDPGVDVSLVTRSEVDNLVVGATKTPARFSATLTLQDCLESLTVQGELSADPADLAARLSVAAAGLRAGPLSAYLPQDVSSTLKDGRLQVRLDAGLSRNPAGGSRARFLLSGFDYRDGPAGARLLKFDAFRALVSRLDPAGKVVTVEEVSLAGLETGAQKTADGGLAFMGLAVGPPREAAAQTMVAPKAEPVPEDVEKAVPPKAAGARRRTQPPHVTLKKLDLALAGLTFHDRSQKDAKPLVAAVRVTNEKPLELLSEEPGGSPPMVLAVEGSATPVVGAFGATARLEPFAAQPELAVDFHAEGIRGAGITEMLPALSDQLDGAQLTDGRLAGSMEAILKVKRRDPLAFDLAKRFGLDVLIQKVAFRNGPEGRVLAGFDECHVDVAAVDPAAGLVDVAMVELSKPRGFVARKSDGIHVLDLVIKMPSQPAIKEGPQDGGTGKEAEGKAPAAQDSKAKQKANPEAPGIATKGPEIRINKILVGGIDFVAEDRSAEPPMHMPITELDVDVRGFSTRGFSEPRPVRFTVMTNAGKVPLPKRLNKGAFLGALSDAVAVVAGDDSEAAILEERTCFEEVLVSGKLAFNDGLNGWVKVGVSALELANFKGPAGATGVTLEDGIFDAGVQLRFKPDGAIAADVDVTFTDLDLSEDPEGPIFRYLHLPAPLDAVLFVLRDENGAIHIPISYTVPADGDTSLAGIAGTAAKTLTIMIGKAIAASPFRVGGTLISMVPLGGDEEAPGEDAVDLSFAPGGSALPGSIRDSLDPILERLRNEAHLKLTLRHQLGGGDLALAMQRAAPRREECLGLSRRLRQRRGELLARRTELASKTRAAYGAGLVVQAHEGSARLRAIDGELGRIENSLDQVLDLLRPGADRRVVRRSRGVSLAIGRARLAAVRRYLLETDIAGIESRVRVRRPQFSEPEGTEGGTVTVMPKVSKAP